MTHVTTTTIHTTPAASTGGPLTRTLPLPTFVAGVAAAAAVTALAAVTHAAGVSLEIDGEMIPFLGFAQMTLLGAVIGGILLAVLNRRSSKARTVFVHTAVVLTAVSCIPSLTWPDDAATKLVLVATHVLAAAMIVPALARHARS